MEAKMTLACFLFIAACLLFVNKGAAKDPIEFITQDHASVPAMTYGFQLLEDIRQIRIICEERRDELEQHFVTDLQNWMKYAQQTQQIMRATGVFGGEYSTQENQQVVEETIANTYKEIYASRRRRLNVIETQCDDSLEELLNQRKLSMTSLVLDLMSHSVGKLNFLVEELTNYKEKLQNGLEECITERATQYESRLSSKVLPPEDYCEGPDIRILVNFLDRMLELIVIEQEGFFGDDEDLGTESPCAESGCEEYSLPHSTLPPPIMTDAETTRPSSLSTSAIPIREPAETETISQPSQNPSTEGSIVITSDKSDPETTQSTTVMEQTDSPQTNQRLTESDNMTSEATQTTSPASTTQDSDDGDPVTEIKSDDTLVTTDINTSTPQVPEWLDDAVKEVLQPQKKAHTDEITEDRGDVSRSHHHDKHEHGSEEDIEPSSNSQNRHSRPQHQDESVARGETTQQDTNTQSESGSVIYRPLIYSFTIVGCVLVVATLVTVAVILTVQHKRRQLLASKQLAESQKIAIMKESGYVNPTYKFFDEQSDG